MTTHRFFIIAMCFVVIGACSDPASSPAEDADISSDADDSGASDTGHDSGDGDADIEWDASSDADTDSSSGELVAVAGPDIFVSDLDGSGAEDVVLDGGRSRGPIVAYEWRNGDEVVASTATASVAFDVGSHDVTLTVTTSAGMTETDTLSVMVIEDSADRPQLFNLPDAPTEDRFVLPADLVWPALGEADICLWSEDRFAVFTITIDDNQAQDHPWWREQLSAREMTATWFVITGSVDDGHPVHGTWAGWTELRDDGHGLGSHARTSGDPDGEGWDEARFRAEYAGSIEDLEANVSGLRALTVAHPWGEYNRAACADHFIAGRGTPGLPNRAHRIDYMNTSSTSAGVSLDLINAVLGEPSGVDFWNRDFYVRGWASVHYHNVPEDRRTAVAAALDELQSHRDQFWVGRYPDVVRYAAERDTAVLNVVLTEEDRIVFTVSDEMDDSIYTFPLTVKLGVPLSWSDVSCEQNGEPCAARVLDNDGARFVLADAVPDRGPIVLQSVP